MVATTGYSTVGVWASRFSGPSKNRTAGLHDLPGIEEVAHRRLDGLVVGGQRPVPDGARREEPSHSVGLHDERMVARNRLHPRRAGRRPVVRRNLGVKIRLVGANPPARSWIPPDQLLSFGPWTPFRVRRGAVVEDAAIERPGEAPFGFDRIGGALPLPRTVPARFGEHSAVDPAAARGHAVVLQLGETRQKARPAGAGVRLIQAVSVDLHEHLSPGPALLRSC